MSDNDLTVLFRRTRAFVARQVAHPKAAPRPPSSGRPRGREPRDHPTPLAMAVAPEPPIETVVIPLGRRERVLTIAVFLAAGCLLGVAAEVAVRPSPAQSGAGAATLVAAASPSASKPGEGRAEGRRSETGGNDNGTARGAHHHAHHPANAANAANAGNPAPSVTPRTGAPGPLDAGGDSDDFAAAVDALTKAKAEVTLP